MFNRFWPKPLEHTGVIQTYNNNARPEESLRNWNAYIVAEKEEDEEADESDEEEEDDEE